ncbi:MAG: helix-turn-helix domain-containing protein [Clostridia bacterium]|nr:helix-turn-helix domain-containing protein [Clostridia bacterium]
MYQVVLISSSRQVTEDFAKKDIWNRDFELACVTEDINEAILKQPHIIICPAKSSIVDGLSVAKQAFEENWSSKVILYGRRTYEYVHLALSSHAFGYLSMPLDNAELVHITMSLKEYFEKQVQVESKEEREDIPLLREYFFYNLCQGAIPDYEQAKSTFESLVPFDDKVNIALGKLTISDFSDYLAGQWKYGKDSLYTAVSNFVLKSDLEDFTVPVFRDGKEMYFMTIASTSKSTLENRILKRNSEVEQQLKDLMSMQVVMREPMMFEGLKDLFEQAKLQAKLPVNKRFEIQESDTIKGDAEKESTVIGNAKEYINNCYNREIGLDDVAAFVQLSPAYFSRLFKQETGENFIDYLIKVRMEHGKRLLETTNHKTYEISQMVGYKKSKYFSKLFKKYSGYTATEYRSYVNKKKQKRQLDRM